MVEIDTLFQTKTAKKNIPFTAAHTFIAYIRDYSPGAKNALQIMSLAAYASETNKGALPEAYYSITLKVTQHINTWVATVYVGDLFCMCYWTVLCTSGSNDGCYLFETFIKFYIHLPCSRLVVLAFISLWWPLSKCCSSKLRSQWYDSKFHGFFGMPWSMEDCDGQSIICM